MIRTIAPRDMKRVENCVMRDTTITGEALMQCAAAHVAEAVRPYQRDGMVLCLCGTGNNGGDGLAAMRILATSDQKFTGQCWLLPGKRSPDAQRELTRLNAEAGTQVSVRTLREGEPIELPAKLDCVIDALFGTGLARPLEGLAYALCEQTNKSNAPVVAVDIPSGLHGETGDVLGTAVKADCTVTFHRPKHGLYLKHGPDHAGKIVIADIGLRVPEAAVLDDADGMAILEPQDLYRLLPKRKRNTHKGSYGRVLLFAGSRGMAGAAAISALAALRTGAGLLTVACPESIVDIVQVLCPCATCLPLPNDAAEAWSLLAHALERADAVGAGCGLGQGTWAEKMIEKLTAWLAEHTLSAVLDADALNLVAKKNIGAIGTRTVITPHPAEAARLLHAEIAEVVNAAPSFAQKLAQTYRASAMVKGACTVLAAGDGMAVNPFGTPGMAKGGSGDALMGIVAALLAGRTAGAYVLNDLELMQVACALHGKAGEIAAVRFGERGMLATDLCECIGLVQGEMPQGQAAPQGRPRRLNATVVVEHPTGSRDQENRQLVYRLNCGYVQQVLDERNEWQDACVLGICEPLEWFDGVAKASARIGDRIVWIVADQDETITEERICSELRFLGAVQQVEMF